MDRKILFIGTGNMGSALIKQIIRKKIIAPETIFAFDKDLRKLQTLNRLGINLIMKNITDASAYSIILLAVKPPDIDYVLKKIGPTMKNDQLLISIAAGVSITTLEKQIPDGTPVIRVMPNMNSLSGAGVSAFSPNSAAGEDRKEEARTLLCSVGEVLEVTENKMNAVTGLSGSGPAYVFLFIQALTDGGVRMGLSREEAYRLALSTVSGSIRTLEKKKLHPAQAIEMITSPGGTTIEALAALESGGFRSTVIEAVRAAAERSKLLGES